MTFFSVFKFKELKKEKKEKNVIVGNVNDFLQKISTRNLKSMICFSYFVEIFFVLFLFKGPFKNIRFGDFRLRNPLITIHHNQKLKQF